MSDRFTILLAEDSVLMRSLIRDMLRPSEQFTIIEVSNGQEALAALHEHPVDMVLSDWNMQPMNGLQLLHAMRGEAELSAIPFVLMTGEQTPQTISHAVAAGVAGFLTKPFGRDQLAKLVTSIILKRSRAA